MNSYTNKIDFRKTKPQKYLDNWTGKKTHVLFEGVCPVCSIRMYSFANDPAPDFRGPLGDHTVSPIIPSEYGMIGDDFKVCAVCANTSKLYSSALVMAKRGWRAEESTVSA